MNTVSIIETLRQNLPPIFARKEIPKLLGGALAAGTLANVASRKIGPPCIRNGRHAIYSKEEFLSWYFVYLSGGIKAVAAKYGELDQLK